MRLKKVGWCAVLLSTTAVLPVASARAQDRQSSAGIAEIIVTAQRRVESAQKAPIVIDTISPEEAAKLSDLRQIQSQVLGVNFANAGAYAQTYVRGVGSFNAKSSQETAVAYSIDGVYVYNTTEVSPAMYDLARIEVLKGPQGTLYGRNSTGGAVNLITQGARLDKLEGYITGEVGNYDLLRVQGALNVPLSSTFAIRLAGQKVQHDGYLSDGTNDDNTLSGRIRMLWEPSADVSLRLNVDAARIRRKGPGAVNYPFDDPDNPWLGVLDPRVDVGTRRTSAFRDAAGNLLNPPFDHGDQFSASAQLDWKLGFATLTLLPAYRYDKIDSLIHTISFGNEDHSKIKERSLEARLANDFGRLSWVLGAYYLDVDLDQVYIIRNPSPPPGAGAPTAFIQDNPVHVKSWAVFAQGTYSLTDELKLIGGLRYTWDKNVASGFQNRFFPSPPFTTAYDPVGQSAGDYVLGARVTDSAPSWKLGVQYDAGPQSMLYATVSRGYKSGGSYNDVPAAPKTFKPEYVTAWEVGSKNRFFDNKLQVNLEAFYWKMKDQQIPYAGFNALNFVAFLTTNAGNATIYGANADATWAVTPNDRFHVGVEYLHSEYDNFVRIGLPSQGTACGLTFLSAGPPPKFSIDCSGQPLSRAPKWSGSASYEHRFDLASGGNVTVAGDMTFASSRYLTIDYSPATFDKGYAVFNAEIAYHAPDDRWSLALWGNNLTKEAYVSGGAQTLNYSKTSINEPRTYGIRMRANF